MGAVPTIIQASPQILGRADLLGWTLKNPTNTTPSHTTHRGEIEEREGKKNNKKTGSNSFSGVGVRRTC
jgi:hypothetical protein